jgi:transglutaminase-like putative cysteine protease
MQLRVGYELIYDCPQPTPMMLMLNIHHSRAGDIVVPDILTTNPSVPLSFYRDALGNWCTRLIAPSGRTRISANAVVNDSGLPEQLPQSDHQHAVQDLPEECLQFLLGSRYCETDRLSDVAWSLFAGIRRRRAAGAGDLRLRASSHRVRLRQRAFDADGVGSVQRTDGVCRDFAHLAIAFCRCMNIPARYCTGYLGDIGTPPPYGPMDFAAWFEAYVEGRWHTFDPRNNVAPHRSRAHRPRQGCDRRRHQQHVRPATRSPAFRVWTDEVSEPITA